MNNAEMKHIFNEEAINNAVNAAVVGWMAKNPTHTSEERAAVSDSIRANILSSRTKDKFLNSKANRSARRAHVAEEVAKHGLQFTTATDLAEVDDTFRFTAEESRGIPLLSILIEEFVNSFGMTKQVERAVTFCFKAEEIGYGHIGIKVAMSFQNPADEPDSLVAREYALSRFLDGKFVEVAVPKLAVEKLGLNRVIRECLNSDVPARYIAKYL